jgi:surface protein
MKALFTFFISCLSGIILAQAPFITTWKTDNPGPSDDYSIRIPLAPGEYDFVINWGDNFEETYEGLGENLVISHTYLEQGTYTISISGVFPRIYFIDNLGDKEKILSVDQWGSIVWTSFYAAFYACVNLHVNALDSPILSDVTNMSGMFSQAIAMNEDIEVWDVSGVENMSGMFNGAQNFNKPIGMWDVSNVQNMSGMFGYAYAFNQNLNNWNVSNVTDMNAMFREALSFNQPLNNWDVSSVTNFDSMFWQATSFNQNIDSWDVSNVLTMANMFYHASSFNQPLNSWNFPLVTSLSQMFRGAESFNQSLNNWDLSNIELTPSMFRGATSFNQPIDGWNVSSIINMTRMFEGATSFNQSLADWNLSACWNFSFMLNNCGMSYCNYDATLQGWAAQELNNGQTLGAMGLEYTAESVTARQSIIDNHGWEITGDVLIVPDVFVVISNVNGPEISIDATGGGGNYTYTWTGPNGFNSNENSILAPQNGLYTVIVTDGCEIWSDSFEVLTVQILEAEKSKVQIFPNPSNGQVQIVAPSTQHLTLYDHSGRMVFNTNINSGYQKLDLSSLMPGVYSGSLISLSGEFLQTVRITLVR